jgi:hypothetical protein
MNRPSLSEKPLTDEGIFSPGWGNWLTQVFTALMGWKKTWNYTFTIDFGNIVANSTLASSAQTIVGVRPTVGTVIGDAVQVTPMTHTSGVIYTGMVTANDQVTIYANNITAVAINPASTVFRVIVIQN